MLPFLGSELDDEMSKTTPLSPQVIMENPSKRIRSFPKLKQVSIGSFKKKSGMRKKKNLYKKNLYFGEEADQNPPLLLRIRLLFFCQES